MSIHKTLHPEELARRNQLAIRYETGKKLDEIEVQIRSIRTAINIHGPKSVRVRLLSQGAKL